jgi:RNA polymerase sigma-70 factor (ECF subfamily)
MRIAAAAKDYADPKTARAALVETLRKTAEGDKAAFERLYRATSAKLFGIVLRIVARHDMAEDVLQEVYIRVWQKAGTFDPERASPITWLAMIARNCALDVARQRQTGSLEDHPTLAHLPSDDDPARACELNDTSRWLQAHLRSLGQRRRDAILLVFYGEVTREEVARRMGLSVPTVKRWIGQSLEQLRCAFEEAHEPREREQAAAT